MNTAQKIQNILQHLVEISPQGYALGLNISLHSPRYLIQTYPQAWATEYAKDGLLLFDPTVVWAVSSTGLRQWSSFTTQEDPRQVLARAASHGLKYGIVGSVHGESSHSLGGFARKDREFSEMEADQLLSLLTEIHHLTEPLDDLPSDLVDALRQLSIRLSRNDHPLH